MLAHFSALFAHQDVKVMLASKLESSSRKTHLGRLGHGKAHLLHSLIHTLTNRVEDMSMLAHFSALLVLQDVEVENSK